MDFRKFLDFFRGNKKEDSSSSTEQPEELNMRLYGIHEVVHFDPADPAVMLTEQQARALATGGLLLASWWLPLKQIVTVRPEMHQKIMTMLKRDWGLTTPKEVVQMMRGLLDEGHRADYQPKLEQNQAYWRAKFDEVDFLQTLPVHSVAGWDFGRVACLAYWALLVGILDQKTAFAYMEEANTLAQQHLHSWEDLAASYLAGLIMWNPDHLERVPFYCGYAKFLLKHEQSVWRQIPWASQ